MTKDKLISVGTPRHNEVIYRRRRLAALVILLVVIALAIWAVVSMGGESSEETETENAAASLMLDEVIPLDSEGKMFCPVIPIAHGEPGTEELAEDIADCLALAPLCIARGHGTFAAAKTLEEGYLFTSLAEHACRVLSLTGSFRKE